MHRDAGDRCVLDRKGGNVAVVYRFGFAVGGDNVFVSLPDRRVQCRGGRHTQASEHSDAARQTDILLLYVPDIYGDFSPSFLCRPVQESRMEESSAYHQREDRGNVRGARSPGREGQSRL